MKKLFVIALAASLAGCVVAPPRAAYYGTRAPEFAGDPSQWHVVSSTPVPNGTGAQVAANGGAPVAYSQPTVVYAPQQPVYVQQPVYAPYYYDPAPVHFSIGLGLGYLFGGGWGHGGYHHYGHRR